TNISMIIHTITIGIITDIPMM
ncbi:MAG: hypothetical protein K0Q59_2274, partial [Paenibacillus sp.]|nr:hypothetical protein [Paenibacillus sp.]